MKKTISPKINLSKCKLKKPKFSLLHKRPKFTPTLKGNISNSQSDILNPTQGLQLEETFYEKEFNYKSIVFNKSNIQLKPKI